MQYAKSKAFFSSFHVLTIMGSNLTDNGIVTRFFMIMSFTHSYSNSLTPSLLTYQPSPTQQETIKCHPLLWISYNLWRVGSSSLWISSGLFCSISVLGVSFVRQTDTERGNLNTALSDWAFYGHMHLHCYHNAVVESFSRSLTLLWIEKFTFYYFEAFDLLWLEGHLFIGFSGSNWCSFD